MVSSISGGGSFGYALNMRVGTRNSSGTSNPFTKSLNTATDSASLPSATTVSLSPAAKAASTLSSFDTRYNNIDHTQAEYNAHYAEGARAVSASQGLPEGQYDFSKMSSKEAFIVANDMIVNHGASPDQVSGLLGQVQQEPDGGANSFTDTKFDFISKMKGELAFDQTYGLANAAKFMKGTLEYLSKMDSKASGE